MAARDPADCPARAVWKLNNGCAGAPDQCRFLLPGYDVASGSNREGRRELCERPHASAFRTSVPASELARFSLGQDSASNSHDHWPPKAKISAAYSKRGLFGQVHSFREYGPERERNTRRAAVFSPQLTPRNGAVPVVLARDDRLRRKLSGGGLVPQEGLEPPTLALRMRCSTG
jgi:hypothetical protein